MLLFLLFPFPPASEIGTLFLVRRRLQEMYDDEEKRRRVRNTNLNDQATDEVQSYAFYIDRDCNNNFDSKVQ